MKTDDVLKKIIKKIKAWPNMVAIFLFDSYVKGTEKPLFYTNMGIILDDPYTEYGNDLFSRNDKFLLEIKTRVLRTNLDMQPPYKRMAQEVLK